jgi:predicted PurR-regulated permease PerM
LGVGFLIFGVPFPVLFGALTFLLTLLPFGGAIPVWLGGAIFLFLNGKIGAGVGLLLWGALLVSSIDNFLKPFLIGERTNIPFFLLFLSLLGGIMTFGLTGLLLGPVIVAVFLSLLNVYTELIQVRGK